MPGGSLGCVADLDALLVGAGAYDIPFVRRMFGAMMGIKSIRVLLGAVPGLEGKFM